MEEIFVFGSNAEGRHEKGAALEALRNHGATYGQARGLQGNSYAIISKKDFRRQMSSSLEEIKIEVDEFIEFAKNHPNLKFNVCEIGCGLGGYTPSEIAPLFSRALDMDNVKLPNSFIVAIYRNFIK